MTYPVSSPIVAFPPSTYLFAVTVRPVGTERVPVATEPRVDGVPLLVQYAISPMFGVDDVETLWKEYKSLPSNPSRVPVQFPVALRESAPAVF